LPLDELSNSTPKNRSPSFIALAEIPPAIVEQERLIACIDESANAQAVFGLLTGDFDALSEEAWNAHRRERQNAQFRLHRLYTEPWRRWANGFSCLSFALIGIPVAIRLRFSEFIASFFACFLPILLVYYPLLAVSVGQAKDGVFPPQAVWLGNIVFATVGIYQLHRVNSK
jgi:lipopolysaccharide export system permease protein